MPLLEKNGILCESIRAPWDDIDADAFYARASERRFADRVDY